MWEVFKKDGIPLYTTRFLFIARLLAWYAHADYNRAGLGWVNMDHYIIK